MGKAELLYVGLAIIVFMTFSSLALRNRIQARLHIINNEIELSAYSQAEAVLNRAWTKNFDRYNFDNGNNGLDINTMLVNATNPGDLGFESDEDSDSLCNISYFNDLDDFDGENPNSFKRYPEQIVTLKNKSGVEEQFYSYRLKTKVDYVDSDDLYTESITKYKKLTILIEITSFSDDKYKRTKFEEKGRSGFISEDWHIKLEKTFSYYPDYHGIDNNE